MPFKTGRVYTLDCGEFGQNLERAGDGGLPGVRAPPRGGSQARKAEGHRLCQYHRADLAGAGETVMVRLDPGGTATVISGLVLLGPCSSLYARDRA